jgi:hypothetical protein
MDKASDIRKLCDDLSAAVEQVRMVFRTTTLDEFETLTRFWGLKDNVCRLVQALSERREETIDLLRQDYSSLLTDVVDVIAFTGKLRVGRIPAVACACHGINESLLTLEYLKQANSAVMTASA